MKVFNEWDKKEYPLPAFYERGPVGREALAERKAAWRAALEWALARKFPYNPRYGDNTMIILSESIERELNET